MQPVSHEEALPDGNRLIKFETTPIMSTYLVAMVVGEFDYIEDLTSDGIRVRVYTPVGKQEQGRFALEVAVKVLPYYKEYFKIPYPLPKMDLIAIGSFAAGKLHLISLPFPSCMIHAFHSLYWKFFDRCYGELGFGHVQGDLSLG